MRSFLNQATPAQLQLFLQQQQWESHQLREIVIHQLPDRLRNLEEELRDRDRVLMDLREERLRLKQRIETLSR